MIEISLVFVDYPGKDWNNINGIVSLAKSTDQYKDWLSCAKASNAYYDDHDVYFILDFGYEEVLVTFT